MARATGSSAIYRALGGLSIRDDLTSTLLPRISFSPTIGLSARRVEKLGMDIRSFREPLKRSVREVIAPSIVRNFDEGGRPAWVPLSAGTLEKRRNFRQTSTRILIVTGLLRRTMGQLNIWDISRDTALIAHLPAKIWYGAIHQGGYSSGSMAARIKKYGGNSRAAFESLQDDLVSAMRSGNPIKSKGTTIPARPFVLLQEEDVDAILQVFFEWFEERANANWPRTVF